MALEQRIFMKGMDRPRYPILQGGMGVNISSLDLVVACGDAGILGTGSSVALDQVVSLRTQEKHSSMEAAERQVREAKELCGYCAMNIMSKVADFEESVEGAVRGKANMIVSGAGLPTGLPRQVAKYAGKEHDIALAPIVSSTRAADLILRKWERQGYRPDALVLEGPKAGGHLGWSYADIKNAGDDFLGTYDLMDVLLPSLMDYLDDKKLDIPVIVAGGIRTYEDITRAMDKGATAVQVATPFIATQDSGATDDYRRALIAGSNDDVMTGDEEWGSPAMMPFRYLKASPHEKRGNYFCIGSGLLSATCLGEPKVGKCPERYLKPKDGNCAAHGNAIYKGLYSAGTEIDSIDRITTVPDIVDGLVNSR
ncbi:MAG: NAD(P)H-dependent flavin oxidoreductase [Nanobdellota archaeon]